MQVSGRPPVVEAARLGQLSTVRKLLDSGTANVEDEDEVSVCIYSCYFKAAIYGTNCVSFLIIHHTLVCVHVVCMRNCVSARLLLK